MDNSGLNTNHNKYINNYIYGESSFTFGDDNKTDKKNFDNQIDVLNKTNKTMIPQNYNLPYQKMYTATPGLFGQRHPPDYNNKGKKNDKYDFLGEYFYRTGDREFNSITRYYTHYLNIDSRMRNKTPLYADLDYVSLPNNPLELTFGSNELFIKTNNLININVNDKISLIGLYNSSKNLQLDENFFEFTENSHYVKINYPHTLYFENVEEAKNFTNKDLFVELVGLSETINKNFINNIPTSTLNTLQQVYLYNPENDDFSNDYFFIKLFRPFSGKYFDINFNKNFIFKLVYFYNYGIPNNKILSQYPINSSTNQGYLLVKKIKKNGIVIDITKKANFNYKVLGNIVKYGGSNICISKIDELVRGNPSPTEYDVTLNSTYNNVIMVKLISSEFPVLNKLVYGCQNNIQNTNNNKLYWENLDDGNIIYSISIDQGNYTMEKLITLIENKVADTQRQTTELLGNYNKKNIIKIEYYEGNHEIKFLSYKEADINDPFIDVIVVDSTAGNYKIKIYHKNHHLFKSDIIIISNALSYSGFLSETLNGKHSIYEIIDDDYYYIYLENVNRYPNSYIEQSVEFSGGNSVKFLVSNYFRLRFDFYDTLGAFFGFRNLGNNKSISVFDTVISNRQLYRGEYLDESLMCLNQENKYVIKTIDLKDDNYIYMTCNTPNLSSNVLNQMITNSKIKNVFSKIQMHHNINIVNNTIYNSFVCNPSYIHNPIQELKELTFNFYDRYGNPLYYYDFEHSFTLEITTINEIPEGTNISAKYPKIN